ncbi:MAG: thiol-disulfide oxidoreductase DCC family protein [Micromonosporaceae bacterium]
MSELPVFLYDGDCGFCTSCARFIQRRIRPRAAVVPWQRADLEALGVTPSRADAAVVWVGRDGVSADGPDAIALLLRNAGWLWRLVGSVLGLRPVSRLAWPIYRWVARNRDRMPGGTPACVLPQPRPAAPAADSEQAGPR